MPKTSSRRVLKVMNSTRYNRLRTKAHEEYFRAINEYNGLHVLDVIKARLNYGRKGYPYITGRTNSSYNNFIKAVMNCDILIQDREGNCHALKRVIPYGSVDEFQDGWDHMIILNTLPINKRTTEEYDNLEFGSILFAEGCAYLLDFNGTVNDLQDHMMLIHLYLKCIDDHGQVERLQRTDVHYFDEESIRQLRKVMKP